jgi:archaellum component FlaC
MSNIEIKTIEERLANCDVQFNKVQGEIKAIEQQEQKTSQEKAQLNVELFRIQGEYRILKSLLSVVEEKKVEEVPAK